MSQNGKTSGLAAKLAAVTAERDKLARGGRLLGRVVSTQGRALMAAWIDAERGDLDAAKETIAQVIEDVHELEPWNGIETGVEWLERTRGDHP